MRSSPAKILIADDEEVMCRALAVLFSSDERFEVIPTAADAGRAIELAGQFQPVVALLDVRMPGGGGAAAALGIRECSPGMRIVALSALKDRETVLRMLRSSLVAAGFEVQEATSGEDAPIAASDFKPDCVVLDLNLPGISGLEVWRLLRLDPAQRQTTIVMLTANRQASDKVEAFALNADDYIVKPFTPRDLVSRVTAAMRRYGPPKPATLELLEGLGSPA